MNIWNKEFEVMTREQLTQWQSFKLVGLVRNVYEKVEYYRNKMKERGVTPDDIKSIEDLRLLPCITKDDLRITYPYGMLASDMNEIVRIHASSGTTGKQTVVGYTQNDLDIWSEVMARTMTAAGGSNRDTVQVAYGYGMFTGGLGAHYGAEKIGAAVIPISGGNTHRQIQTMVDFGTTLLACTPSYALYITEALDEMKIDKSKLKLRKGVFGAEPWSDNMRREIEQRLNIKAHDIYGLSEIIGPGVAFECECQCGLHINEDHFVPEIIDPQTEQPLPAGERGELVFTTITKTGMPLIRYRTKDIACLTYDKCDCGRTLVRMEKVRGRSDDMLIIRGVNVFPSQIESALLEVADASPHYMIIVDRVGTLDTLEVQVEMDENIPFDEVKQVERYERRIRESIERIIGISAKIRVVEPKSLPRSEGKAKRVVDNRKIF